MTEPRFFDRETILREVQQWPVADHVALAEAIPAEAQKSTQLELPPPAVPAVPAVPSAALRGILANGEPAPSDKKVSRMVDEERRRKYGG